MNEGPFIAGDRLTEDEWRALQAALPAGERPTALDANILLRPDYGVPPYQCGGSNDPGECTCPDCL